MCTVYIIKELWFRVISLPWLDVVPGNETRLVCFIRFGYFGFFGIYVACYRCGWFTIAKLSTRNTPPKKPLTSRDSSQLADQRGCVLKVLFAF